MPDQVHDAYGKEVLRAAAGRPFKDWGAAVEVNYGTKTPARIDGVVADIAVEVESRTPKQIRGAVLDLICHRHPRKLLVIMPVYQSNVQATAEQCRHALGCFVKPEHFRVIVTLGHGYDRRVEEDAQLVRAALQDLGFSAAPGSETSSPCRVCGEELTTTTRQRHEICEIRKEEECRRGATPPELDEAPPSWDNIVRRIEEGK